MANWWEMTTQEMAMTTKTRVNLAPLLHDLVIINLVHLFLLVSQQIHRFLINQKNWFPSALSKLQAYEIILLLI